MSTQTRGGVPVNDQQFAIIDDLVAQGPGRRVTVVSAGAGSGKTYTTVAAVLHLIETRDANAEQFILITFTEKAAEQLRERLEEALQKREQAAGADLASRRRWAGQRERLAGAYVGTVHGFCRTILRTYGCQERVARSADATRSVKLLQDAVLAGVEEACRAGSPLLADRASWDECQLRDLVEEILKQAEALTIDVESMRKNTEEQPPDPGKPYRVALAILVKRVRAAYCQSKSESQILDSADQLSFTATLLEGTYRSEIVQQLTSRFRYLFIDEFQDTDRIQKRIVDVFLGHLAALVVGDTKQSLYGWRAADVSLLAEIAGENRVDPLSLSISRRPTRLLLAAQNALFKSVGRTYPDLKDPLEPWEGTIEPRSGIRPFTLVRAGPNTAVPSGTVQTADQVRRWLTCSIDDPETGVLRQVVPGDIAVLFRSNWVLQRYEEELARLLHPVRAQHEGGGRFYQRPEIVATYQVLRLLLDFPDDTVLAVALDTPYFAQVDATAEERRLIQYGKQRGHPLSDWFQQAHPTLAAGLAELRGLARTGRVSQILGRAYEIFGVREAYVTRGNRQAAENLEKLRELARKLSANEQALTLRQYLLSLRRSILARVLESYAPLDGESRPTSPPYVRLMTTHAAKGLEFPLVIIPEVQQPLIRPDLDPVFLLSATDGLDVDLMNEAGLSTKSQAFDAVVAANRSSRLEEEMRVFYVAVTRAQHAVAFIVSGPGGTIHAQSDRKYSWADELRAAWKDLSGLATVI